MIENLFLGSDPRLPNALGPWFTHEYINYYSITSIDWLMKLDPINILPNPKFKDWKIGPNHVDLYKEEFIQKREIPLSNAADASYKNSDFSRNPPNAKIEPWKILIHYCVEPDSLLDVDVKLHWSQNLVGGSHGLRHMKFKMFGYPIGQVDKNLHYYISAAKRSYEQGNLYWGWRFLSRATHYAADIGHPMHVKIAPLKESLLIFRFNELLKNVTAAHNAHEVYTQSMFRNNYKPFRDALHEGTSEGFNSTQKFNHALKNYAKFSKKMLNPLYRGIIQNFGEDLVNLYSDISLNAEMDMSKKTNLIEKSAHNIIFRDSSNEGLNIMESITHKLLMNVGFILGLLIRNMKEIGFGNEIL